MGALEADAGQGHWESLQGGSGAPVTTAGTEDSGGQGGYEDSGGHGGSGASGGHGGIYFLGRSRQRSHSDPDQSPMHGHYGYQDHGYMPPQKMFLGGLPAGTRKVRVLQGARKAQTLGADGGGTDLAVDGGWVGRAAA